MQIIIFRNIQSWNNQKLLLNICSSAVAGCIGAVIDTCNCPQDKFNQLPFHNKRVYVQWLIVRNVASILSFQVKVFEDEKHNEMFQTLLYALSRFIDIDANKVLEPTSGKIKFNPWFINKPINISTFNVVAARNISLSMVFYAAVKNTFNFIKEKVDE